jgi:heparanase
LPSERYTLSSPDLLGGRADLNGRELKVGQADSLPEVAGEPAGAGAVRLAPATITFLAFSKAGNASCR